MNENQMAKELAESVRAFSEPLDFDQLIKDGLLICKGKSYYVPNLDALPEKVRKRIKSMNPSKNGIRVTFYKETKGMKKLALKLSDY